MDWLYWLAVLTIAYFVVCIYLILTGDCDIILYLFTKYGKKPDVLRGKVVWITGASSGIGEYLSYELAKAGCRLCLSARRKEELERVKKQCLLSGKTTEENILVLPLDVLKLESHTAAFGDVCKKFGQVDILVNNAGRSQRAAWEKTDLLVDRDMLELNVIAVLSLTKTVLPSMLDRHDGHIVNMSSVAGKIGAPLSGSYTGAKHALQGWFDCLRVEVATRGVSVTSICPGPVFSNILSTAFTENHGEELGGAMKTGEKRMSTERCAELCAVAMANKLDEVWLSNNPVLFFLYLNQYFPNLAKIVSKRMGLNIIKKIREGQQ
ncbi:hypothetical protein FSP39_005225 [Pinctada imbricata]|uniref:Dehydrogenase/reductase SDR family member 7 n=1 Tax=Pinctada imbricata TaxID=66713 RepID=A0AA88XVI2_PINIB|nr:hypothetical protein FSP39_005225 [Pinctada imbricata]